MCPDHNVGDLHEDDPVAQEVYNEDDESSDFNKPFGITNDALLDIADFSQSTVAFDFEVHCFTIKLVC